MFIGEFTHSLDPKGRVALPAKFRKDLRGGIMTHGLDKCLFMFSKEEWGVLAKKIVSLPLAQANSRAFSRLMLSGAGEAEIDPQGRILIPEYLRTYANLEKEIVITGVFNRIEIWDEKTWKHYKARTESASDEIAEKMGELGI